MFLAGLLNREGRSVGRVVMVPHRVCRVEIEVGIKNPRYGGMCHRSPGLSLTHAERSAVNLQAADRMTAGKVERQCHCRWNDVSLGFFPQRGTGGTAGVQ